LLILVCLILALIELVYDHKLEKYPYKKKNKDHVINFEILPADHSIKKFILNPVEASRSALTRSSNQNQSWVDNGDKVPESTSHMFK
jgi:hypothetical protein